MDKILNNNYCEKEREIETSRSNESAGAGELRQTKQPPGFPARFRAHRSAHPTRLPVLPSFRGGCPDQTQYQPTPAPTHHQAHQNQLRLVGEPSRRYDVRLYSRHHEKCAKSLRELSRLETQPHGEVFRTARLGVWEAFSMVVLQNNGVQTRFVPPDFVKLLLS